MGQKDLTSPIKGIYVHDSTGWQPDAIKECSKRGVVCVWWHNYNKNTISLLRGVLDGGEKLEFYYLVKNIARYKAVIRDFAVKEDYVKRVPKWKEEYYRNYVQGDSCQFKPEERFDMYEDVGKSGKIMHPEIVFLVSDFEELPTEPEIRPENIVRYGDVKDASYNIRAFTDIKV
ncbi:MAG: hypothetical protein LUC44_03500, partial [Prevotellaceae bacterium]|nr:hypothetical protein [Prevotellaceae bacterium]